MAKTKEKVQVFEATQMTVNRLDYSGSTEEPQARLHLQVPLADQMAMDLNLDGALTAPEIDLDKGVHLHPGPLDLGDTFKIDITSAPDENSNHCTLIESRKDASLISARAKNAKGSLMLTMSVLIPLRNWDEFGFLVDYMGREVEVTIWPGVKQTDLPMED